MPPRLFWILRMAWRDSRGSRAHLLLSIFTIAVGMAALVAIRSFGDHFERAMNDQARTLLGADLVLRSTQPFSPAAETLIASLPGHHVREVRFYSMAEFPSTGFIRLSHIRALHAPFPLYGDIRTDPPHAAHTYLDQRSALVEDSLLHQAGANVGDTIRIGNQDILIAGRLLHIAGEAPATAAFMGPRIYLHADTLATSLLLGEGSIARYHVHIKLPPHLSARDIQQTLRSDFNHHRIETETVDQRKQLVGNTLLNIYRYLNLGSLTAFLLGGIGLSGSIQLYIRKKRPHVAVLRCIGCDAPSAFAIYLIQATAAALLGTLLGAAGGMLIQQLLPLVLADFLPVTVVTGWSWTAVGLSLAFGFLLAWAFALLPLVTMRNIPPLEALRPPQSSIPFPRLRGFRIPRPDPWVLAITAFILLTLALFAVLHTQPRTHGLILTAALILIFLLLGLTAFALITLARSLPLHRAAFAWRHGIANLYRPGHQTPILLLSLGVGVFLIALMSLLQSTLNQHFRGADRDQRPNLIFFDIQPHQLTDIQQIVLDRHLEIIETAPIITKRLAAIDGRPIRELRNDPSRDIPPWALFREYRSTIRDHLTDAETLVAGTWIPRIEPGTSIIPISLEDGIAQTLGVTIGSRLDFDLQGVTIRTRVASLRNVNWRQMRTNFFVVFPQGSLERAPYYLAIVTRAPDPASSAQLQQAVVAHSPNISAIDLRMIVESMNQILGQASAVIHFLSILCIITGLMVMAATVVAGRADRRDDSLLLHTLGATRLQLFRVMAAEHLLLGGLASLAGILLALLAGWALSHWAFDMAFAIAWPQLLLLPLLFMAATLLTGLLATPARSTSR
ncbi:MAG TPA: ABC transporter permease [Kiritimatiellia bacterium]|nr:ABC transporter permease [Kiritimatiellia bacterium]